MNENTDANKQSSWQPIKSQRILSAFEISFWIAFSIYSSGEFFQKILFGSDIPGHSNLEIAYSYIDLIVLFLLWIIFPFVFKKIFGQYPIILSIQLLKGLSYNKNYDNSDNVDTDSDPLDIWSAKKIVLYSPIEYLAGLAISSRKLAKGLRSRSGVYLFIGVIIAFTGILFFYSQVSAYNRDDEFSTLDSLNGTPAQKSEAARKVDAADTTVSNNKNLIHMAQSFGILFFIEFIAFFFLKQYRSAMDEFRYYESLQRYREETLAMMKFLKEERDLNPGRADKDLEIYAFVERCGFRTSVEKLENGQTTELLETKKLNKDETEIFNKILDILGKK